MLNHLHRNLKIIFDMLSVGTNVRVSSDPLKKITIEYLYNALRHPKPNMMSKIEQLRIVRQMNPEQYSKLKSQLPFFVCASFNPPFRKTENFAYTEYFVVDIDHIEEKGMQISDLKLKITSDSRTVLCFTSPSQDGLKVMFRLSEKCYDPGIYSVFYKKFLYDFGVQYGIEQVVDSKTSDVSRACFMSVDFDAYYNPLADAVEMKSFIPIDDTSELLEFRRDLEKSASKLELGSDTDNHIERSKEPDEEAISKIRASLDMKIPKQKIEREVIVPQELEAIINDLVKSVGEIGIEVHEIQNIQYGKKIRARLGRKKAEVNLFYGKRGFSVVVSPKTGTDANLNQLLADAVRLFVEG